MNNIYLHIGYPKCASTFLQRNIFPNIPGYEFFDKYSETCSSIRNLKNIRINVNCIISDESIMGEFLLPKEVVWNRIKTFIDNNSESKVTVIAIIRPEMDLYNSLYAEWVSWGVIHHSRNFFLECISNGWYGDNYNSSIMDLDYFSMELKKIGVEFVIADSKIFKKIETLKLFFNKFDLTVIVDDISPVRQSFDNLTLSIQRHFNKLLFSRFNPSGIIKNQKLPFVSFWVFSKLDIFFKFIKK